MDFFSLRIVVTLMWFLLWSAFWMYHILGGETETSFVMILLVTAFLIRHVPKRIIESVVGAFRGLARHSWIAVATISIIVLVVREALLPMFPVPVP